MSLWRAIWIVATREMQLALRQRSEVWMGLAFFVVVLAVVRLALSAEPELLRRLSPLAVWIAAVTANVIGVHNALEEDQADGSLEQMLLSRLSTLGVVVGKMVAYWVLMALPMMVLTYVLAPWVFGLDQSARGVLMLSLLLGSPALSTQGVFTAALRLRIDNATAVLCLVIVPIYAALILIAQNVVAAHLAGQSMTGDLASLLGLTAFACFVEPFITASALRTAQG